MSAATPTPAPERDEIDEILGSLDDLVTEDMPVRPTVPHQPVYPDDVVTKLCKVWIKRQGAIVAEGFLFELLEGCAIMSGDELVLCRRGT